MPVVSWNVSTPEVPTLDDYARVATYTARPWSSWVFLLTGESPVDEFWG